MWLAAYLIKVNAGPPRGAPLPTYAPARLPRHDGPCALRELPRLRRARPAQLLRLAPNATRSVVAAFARASRSVVMTSHEQSLAKPLLIPPSERARCCAGQLCCAH